MHPYTVSGHILPIEVLVALRKRADAPDELLEQLSLLLVGHFVELLVNWHASVDRLVDVDAPQRFPATNWCGSAALRVGILLLADGGSQVGLMWIKVGLMWSSDGQQPRPSAGPPPERAESRARRAAA